jgi:hypothetical protein
MGRAIYAVVGSVESPRKSGKARVAAATGYA